MKNKCMFSCVWQILATSSSGGSYKVYTSSKRLERFTFIAHKYLYTNIYCNCDSTFVPAKLSKFVSCRHTRIETVVILATN